MNFELCTDSIEGALAAEKFGLQRIELCSALSLGGLTPNYGLLKQCVKLAKVEVHVMIRHREGDFYYSKDDVELMKVDIKMAHQAGASGVVFGILNKKNEVSNLNLELVKYAKSLNLEVTFHRAFDFTSNYKEAIDTLLKYGFDRLLTSGLESTAYNGLEIISYLQANYGNKIEIMAGSGVNPSNALDIANTGINSLHFTSRKKVDVISKFDMGARMVTDEEKIKNIVCLFN
jgi:copper homeostasis protein